MNESTDYKKPRILPMAWLLIAIAAMFVLDRFLPLAELPAALSGLPLWLSLAPGVILIFLAMRLFVRAKTNAIPFSESTTLVTTGIYRFTRNPMYLGMSLFLAGAALKFGSYGACLPVPLFIWVIHRQFILNEEKFLTGIYGEEFTRYRKKVRRWI